MNIVSSVFVFIGVILLLVDVSINGQPNQDYWAVVSILWSAIASTLPTHVEWVCFYFSLLPSSSSRNSLFLSQPYS